MRELTKVDTFCTFCLMAVSSSCDDTMIVYCFRDASSGCERSCVEMV